MPTWLTIFIFHFQSRRSKWLVQAQTKRAARAAPAADRNAASTTMAGGKNAAGGASRPRGN